MTRKVVTEQLKSCCEMSEFVGDNDGRCEWKLLERRNPRPPEGRAANGHRYQSVLMYKPPHSFYQYSVVHKDQVTLSIIK